MKWLHLLQKKKSVSGKSQMQDKNSEIHYTKKTEVGRQCNLLITTTITDTWNGTYYMPTVLTTSYAGESIYS